MFSLNDNFNLAKYRRLLSARKFHLSYLGNGFNILGLKLKDVGYIRRLHSLHAASCRKKLLSCLNCQFFFSLSNCLLSCLLIHRTFCLTLYL